MDRHTESYALVSLSVVLIGTPLVTVLTGIATDSQAAQDWGQMSMWVLYPIAAWLMTRSSKLEAPTVDELLAQDKRPPVLYLRSFSEDKRNSRGRILKTIFDPTDGYKSREEEMVEWAKEIGPVIAVGRPGERLPELGAARMYVSDDEWRERIGKLLDGAGFVVMRAASTPGIRWELGEAVRRRDLRSLIIVLPDSDNDYAQFRGWANEVLPIPLPEVRERNCGYLALLEDGTPYFAEGLYVARQGGTSDADRT